MSVPSRGVNGNEARRFLTDLKSMQRKKEDHWMAVGFGRASSRKASMGSPTRHCLTTNHACAGSPPSGWLASEQTSSRSTRSRLLL